MEENNKMMAKIALFVKERKDDVNEPNELAFRVLKETRYLYWFN
jgi:hypothetical protein